jgi:putative spermidine/putrescine transport system permease protein
VSVVAADAPAVVDVDLGIGTRAAAAPGRGRGRWLLFGVWGLFVALPIVAVALYSLATVWRNESLPDGITLRWWRETLTQPRVVDSLIRSLWLGGLTVLIVAVVTVPPLYWSYVRNPRARTIMQVSALLPFALPFVVLAYGMKNLAQATELTQAYEASTALLVLGHVALSFPFFMWPVDGAMAAAGVRSLHAASATCGAGPVTTLVRVVLPSIRAGLLTGAMLCFATSFGEYSIAKVITGSSFETLPVWQVTALDDTRGNPNGVAVMAMFTLAVIVAVSFVVVRLGRGQTVQLLPGVDLDRERS